MIKICLHTSQLQSDKSASRYVASLKMEILDLCLNIPQMQRFVRTGPGTIYSKRETGVGGEAQPSPPTSAEP